MKKIIRACLVAMLILGRPAQTVSATPTIYNIAVVSTAIAPYDKFETTFNVITSASNLQWPYATSTPSGVPAATGISVDGEFSRDVFATFVSQPAFLYQPMTLTDQGQDHLIPNGAAKWMIRFTPKQIGTWLFRVRARDATGTSLSSAAQFRVVGQSVNTYKRKGFLKVSQTDSRYFEFSDGSPYIGAGFNGGFISTQSTESSLATYETNKINLLRVWMSVAGINGTQWTSWANFNPAGGGGGYLPPEAYAITNTLAGADVALLLNTTVPCIYSDFNQARIGVEPNTTYNLSLRAKTVGLTGGARAGFVGKLAGFQAPGVCNTVDNGTILVGPILGDTGYTTYTASFTTAPGQYLLSFLHLTVQGITGGSAFVDEVKLTKASDSDQINILREGNVNAHLYFDQFASAIWDKYIESAETHGVYLKLVIDEKSEWIRNHIDVNGATTATATEGNFYAAANTKVRFLLEAWWRYLIARWGYSTAIHSFELINEGNPYNGNHYELANAFADYIHANDPNLHMASTSFWAAFPAYEFWANSHADYTDLHAYLGTGWGVDASFLSGAWVESNPRNIRSGNGSARIDATNNGSVQIGPVGMSIKGQGVWIIRYWAKAESFTSACNYGSTGSRQKVTWTVDGGTYAGGTQGIVPPDPAGVDFVCSSKSGTYGWTQFSSDKDRNGNPVSPNYGIVITDTNTHKLMLSIANAGGTSGTAWFDDVQLIAPDGRTLQVIGTFDRTPLRDDTTQYALVYAQVHGARSIVGTDKPYIRGESGIDLNGNYDLALNADITGLWLHNMIWAGASSAANTDLAWWADGTIDRNGGGAPLYPVYAAYRNFMEGIPVNNGNYNDANAFASTPFLRVLGQRDDANRKAHLWIGNLENTWTRSINGPAVRPITGTVQLRGWPAGSYIAQWWSTTTITNQVYQTDTLTASSNGVLTLVLPIALTSDVAVKIENGIR